MKNLKLTKAQKEIMECIIFWKNNNGSITVDGRRHNMLKELEKMGLIKVTTKGRYYSALLV
jgi:hypothetical protein